MHCAIFASLHFATPLLFILSTLNRIFFFLVLLSGLSVSLHSMAQTMQAAVGHIENLEKTADAATATFFEYASVRFLNQKEKDVARRKNKMLDVLQNQDKRITHEKGFNGQTRLKSGYGNFVEKLRQFPENLGSYTESTPVDYRTGVAQKRNQDFMAQLDLLKAAAIDLNLEVFKYITLNKCKDFSKGSTMPDKWKKAHSLYVYEQKMMEPVFTLGALDRYFYELLSRDSLDKAEAIRITILQNSASWGGAVKAPPPIPKDFTLREAAVNSINLYRMDAFRNFKSLIASRRKELAFQKKYPASPGGKNDAPKPKFEKEKADLESELSSMRSLVKELKKERDKHESAFSDYLAQYLDKHTLEE